MTQKKSETSLMDYSKYPVEVSVIACHHKGEFIYKFVDSVKKSTGVNYEIIIITSDDHLAVTGIKGCRVFNGDQYPAAKRNTGYRVSSGKYIAFFDDDIEIEPDCLLRYKEFMDSNPTVGMAYGKLYNMERRDRFDEAGGFLTSTGFIWSRAAQNDIDTGQYDVYETIFAGKSASCIIREELFFKVGGFDEDFQILGEESDLSWRLWLAGHKVCFLYDAVGYHAFNTVYKPAKEYYTSTRVHRNGCRNYITMLLKNLEVRNLWKILPIHLVVWFFAMCAMIGTLRLKEGINIAIGLKQVLGNLSNTLKKRRQIQSSRVITDKELFTYIFRNPPRTYYTQRFLRYITLCLHG